MVLHRQSISKAQINAKTGVVETQRRRANEELKKSLKRLKTSLSEITYDRHPIEKLFPDNPPIAPLTFLAKRMDKAKTPIYLSRSLLPKIDYNFFRNSGYVSEAEEPKIYHCIEKLLRKRSFWEKRSTWETLNVSDITQKYRGDFSALEPNLFLDFTSSSKLEEAYTKMIYHLFESDPHLINDFFLAYLNASDGVAASCLKPTCPVSCSPSQMKNIATESFSVYSEKMIDGAGRLDLYAESEPCQLIIENKIASSIGYRKKGGDQLSRYYRKLSPKKKPSLFLLLAPDSRLELFAAEINDLPGEAKGHYGLIGYGFLYSFFYGQRNRMGKSPFAKYFDDAFLLFKRLSFSRQQLCELKLVEALQALPARHP